MVSDHQPVSVHSVASSHQLMEPVFTLRVSSLIQKQRHRDRDTAQQDTEDCRIQSTAALQHTAGAGGGPLVEIWLSESHLTAPHQLWTCHQCNGAPCYLLSLVSPLDLLHFTLQTLTSAVS